MVGGANLGPDRITRALLLDIGVEVTGPLLLMPATEPPSGDDEPETVPPLDNG